MGDRYQWTDKCPNCGHPMQCFYADSCGIKDVKCSKCHVEYEIVLSFELREKKPEKLPEKRGLTVDEIISKYPESVRILLGELLLKIENLQKPEIRIRPRFSKRTEVTDELIEEKTRELFGWAAEPHTVKECRDFLRSLFEEKR